MTFEDILEAAKGHGYKYYADGNTEETLIDTIIENNSLDGDNYTLTKMDEYSADIATKDDRGELKNHIGTVFKTKN